jgi:hypothetical protein
MVKISSSPGLHSPGVGEICIGTGVRDGMFWVWNSKSRERAVHAHPTNKKPTCLRRSVFRMFSVLHAVASKEDRTTVGSIWWAVQGSNLRPLPCEGNALPLS